MSECSKALIHDWYVDGRVDKTYPVHCYREALKQVPEDQIIYGSLRDDLNRALQSAIRQHGGHVSGSTLVVPTGGGGGGGNGPDGNGATGNGGVFHWLAQKLGPSTADSIPIPLLILGGLALDRATDAGPAGGDRSAARRPRSFLLDAQARTRTGREARGDEGQPEQDD
jgi:hypothetical protein